MAEPMLPRDGFRSFARAGDTPLHLAVVFVRTKVIELLLKAGASVNATNLFGESPSDVALRPPRGADFFWLPPRMSRALDPPGSNERPEPLSLFILPERRQSAASLLEKAGAERLAAEPPGIGPRDY